MTDDKYQIFIKSQYLTLLILKDELTDFDSILSEVISNSETWLRKLRATRSVFLTLNNIKDITNKIQINDDKAFVAKTRTLRKNLEFANHFRNKGIGHLDNTLLKRSVQWNPQLFLDSSKENETFKTMEAHRTIIESCINSYLDDNGVQKIFKTEIDLMYPPDGKEFYDYLSKIVHEALVWLSECAEILVKKINHHTEKELYELAVVAAKTNFNLTEEPDLTYSIQEAETRFLEVIEILKKHKTDPKTIEFLQKELKTHFTS